MVRLPYPKTREIEVGVGPLGRWCGDDLMMMMMMMMMAFYNS